MKRTLIPAAFILLSACASSHQEVPLSFLGDPVSPTATTQTIVIQPDTRWVNVIGGDMVRFVAGDKEFSWVFNVAANIHSFELNRIAPTGMLDHKVQVYVAPDPKYIGGDGRGS